MKKHLSKIAYFLILFFVGNRLSKLGFNWMESNDSVLSWTGAITVILCIFACFVSGWEIGRNVADAVIYWRSNRRK